MKGQRVMAQQLNGRPYHPTAQQGFSTSTRHKNEGDVGRTLVGTTDLLLLAAVEILVLRLRDEQPVLAVAILAHVGQAMNVHLRYVIFTLVT